MKEIKEGTDKAWYPCSWTGGDIFANNQTQTLQNTALGIKSKSTNRTERRGQKWIYSSTVNWPLTRLPRRHIERGQTLNKRQWEKCMSTCRGGRSNLNSHYGQKSTHNGLKASMQGWDHKPPEEKGKAPPPCSGQDSFRHDPKHRQQKPKLGSEMKSHRTKGLCAADHQQEEEGMHTLRRGQHPPPSEPKSSASKPK